MPQTIERLEKRLPTHAQIAERAHQLYVARGRQPGREIDDWLQAEYELLQLPLRRIAELGAAKATGRKRRAWPSKSALLTMVQAALLLG